MAPLISAQGLSKRYGNAPLFQDLSFTVSEGERIGVIGPNGSGKSTLIEMLYGRVKRTSWVGPLRGRLMSFPATAGSDASWSTTHYLFRDNDGIYGDEVSRFLVGTRIEEVKTAHRCPWQNLFVVADGRIDPLVQGIRPRWNGGRCQGLPFAIAHENCSSYSRHVVLLEN